MSAEMEGQVLFVQENGAVVALFACLSQLGQRVVGTLDVGGVVLAVMKLIDLPRDVRLQGTVVVVQVRKRVVGHEIPFCSRVFRCILARSTRSARRKPLPSSHSLGANLCGYPREHWYKRDPGALAAAFGPWNSGAYDERV